MNRKSKGGGKNSKTKKDRSLVYHVVKIWTVCLLVAFCLLGGLAVKKVGIPVLSMYKEARETVENYLQNTDNAKVELATAIINKVKEGA